MRSDFNLVDVEDITDLSGAVEADRPVPQGAEDAEVMF